MDVEQQKKRELERVRVAALLINHSLNERMRHEAAERKKKQELKYLDRKVRERNRLLYSRRMIPKNDKKPAMKEKDECIDSKQKRKPMVPRFSKPRKKDSVVEQESDDELKSSIVTECAQENTKKVISSPEKGILAKQKKREKARNREGKSMKSSTALTESVLDQSRQEPSKEILERRQRARDAMKIQRKRRQEHIAKERQAQLEAKQRMQAKLEQLEKVRLLQLLRSKKYKPNDHPPSIVETCKEELARTPACLIHCEVDIIANSVPEKELLEEEHEVQPTETEIKHNERSNKRIEKLKELQERTSYLSAQLDRLRASRQKPSFTEVGDAPDKDVSLRSAELASEETYSYDNCQSMSQDGMLPQPSVIPSPIKQRYAEISPDVIESTFKKVERSITLADHNGTCAARTPTVVYSQSYSSPQSVENASESVSESSLPTDSKMSTGSLFQVLGRSNRNVKPHTGIKFSLKDEDEDPLMHLLKEENDSLSVFDQYARELYELDQQARAKKVRSQNPEDVTKDISKTCEAKNCDATAVKESNLQGTEFFLKNNMDSYKARGHTENLKLIDDSGVGAKIFTETLLGTKLDDVRSIESGNCREDKYSIEHTRKENDHVVHLDVSELEIQKTMQQRCDKLDQLGNLHCPPSPRFSPDTLSKHLLAAVEFRDHIHEAQLKVCLLEKTRELEEAQRDSVSYALALKNEVEENYLQQRLHMEQNILEKQTEARLHDVVQQVEMKKNDEAARLTEEAKRLQEELKRERLRENGVQTEDWNRQKPQLTTQDSKSVAVSNESPLIDNEEYESDQFEISEDQPNLKFSKSVEDAISDPESDCAYSSSPPRSERQETDDEVPSDILSTSFHKEEISQHDQAEVLSYSDVAESEAARSEENFDSESHSMSQEQAKDKFLNLVAPIESDSDYADDFEPIVTAKASLSVESIVDDEIFENESDEPETSIHEEQSYSDSASIAPSVSAEDVTDTIREDPEHIESSVEDLDVPHQPTNRPSNQQQTLLNRYLSTVKERLQREITAIEMYYQAELLKHKREESLVEPANLLGGEASSRQRDVQIQLRAAQATRRSSIAACKAKYYQDILIFQQSLLQGAHGGIIRENNCFKVQLGDELDQLQSEESASTPGEQMLDQDASSSQDYESFEELSENVVQLADSDRLQLGKKSEGSIASEDSPDEKSLQSIESHLIQSAESLPEAYNDDDFVPADSQSEIASVLDPIPAKVLTEVHTEDSSTSKHLQEQLEQLQSLKMEYSQPAKRLRDDEIERKLQRVQQLIELKNEVLTHERDRLYKEHAYRETDALAKIVLKVDVHTKATMKKDSDTQFNDRIIGLEDGYKRLVHSTKVATSDFVLVGDPNRLDSATTYPQDLHRPGNGSDNSQHSRESEEIYEDDSFEVTEGDGPQSEASDEADEEYPAVDNLEQATELNSTDKIIEDTVDGPKSEALDEANEGYSDAEDIEQVEESDGTNRIIEDTERDDSQSEASNEADEEYPEIEDFEQATTSNDTNEIIEETENSVVASVSSATNGEFVPLEASEDGAESTVEDSADKSGDTSIYESSFEQSSVHDLTEMAFKYEQTEMSAEIFMISRSEVEDMKPVEQVEEFSEVFVASRSTTNAGIQEDLDYRKEFKADPKYETSFKEASNEQKDSPVSAPLDRAGVHNQVDIEHAGEATSNQTAQISNQFVACQLAFDESYSAVQEIQSSQEQESLSEDSLQAQAERIKSLNNLLHEKEKLVRRVHKQIAREREKESLGVEEENLLRLLGRMEEQFEIDTTILDALRQQNAHSRADFERRKQNFEARWTTRANNSVDLLHGYVHVEAALKPSPESPLCVDVGSNRISTFSLDLLREFEFVESALPPESEGFCIEQSTQTSTTYPTISDDSIRDEKDRLASLPLYDEKTEVTESECSVTGDSSPIDQLANFDHVEDVEPLEEIIIPITDDRQVDDDHDKVQEYSLRKSDAKASSEQADSDAKVAPEQGESIPSKKEQARRISAHLFTELEQGTLSDFLRVESTIRYRARLHDSMRRLLRQYIGKRRLAKASALATHISTELCEEAMKDHIIIERVHACPSTQAVVILGNHPADRRSSLHASSSNEWSPGIMKCFGQQLLSDIGCGLTQDCDMGQQMYAPKDVAHSAIMELVGHAMKERDWIKLTESAEYVSTQRFLIDQALASSDPSEQYEVIWSQAQHIPEMSNFLLYWLSQVMAKTELDERFEDENLLQGSNVFHTRSLSLFSSQYSAEERGLTERLTDALMADMLNECSQ